MKREYNAELYHDYSQPSVDSDAQAQAATVEQGRRTLNQLAGALPGSPFYVGPEGDPLLKSEMTRRAWPMNNPPQSVTDPQGNQAGSAWPAIAYASDGRFQRIEAHEWPELQREGWKLRPFEGFDYSHYRALTEGVWLASTYAQAERERYHAQAAAAQMRPEGQ